MNVTDLPDLIVLKILSYLDQQDLVFGIRQTCQKWSSLSYHISFWREICLDVFQPRLSDNDFLELLKPISNHVEKLDFNVTGIFDPRYCPPPSKQMTKKSYLHVGIHCKQLKHICFQQHLNSGVLDPSSVGKIVKKYPNLETFDAKGVEMKNLKKILKHLSQLKSLKSLHVENEYIDIEQSEDFFNESISKLFQSCTFLEHVSISTLDLSNSTILCLIKSCSNLRSLCLAECRDMDLLCCNELRLSCILNLTHLDISFTDVCNEGLECIAQMCPHLESLNVDGCRITNPGYESLANYCHKLKKIEVCSGYYPGLKGYIGGSGLESLGHSCPDLGTIEINYCTLVTDTGLSTLAAGCRNLKTVSALCCFMVTDIAVTAISDNCKQIKYLDFSYCFEITSESVSKLMEACPQLRTLKLKGCRDLVGIFQLPRAPIDSFGPVCSTEMHHQLSFLDISHCSKIDTESIAILAQCCPELRSLYLTCCNSIRDSDVDLLVNHCRLLQHLDISGGASDHVEELICDTGLSLDIRPPKLGDQSLFSIAKHCTNLQHLEITENTNITFDGIRNIIENCSPLRNLSFSVGDGYAVKLLSFMSFVDTFQIRDVKVGKTLQENGSVSIELGKLQN